MGGICMWHRCTFAENEYRHLALVDYLMSYAAQHPAREAGSPVTAYDDQICCSRLGSSEDIWCGQAEHHLGGGVNTRKHGRPGHSFEVVGSIIKLCIDDLLCPKWYRSQSTSVFNEGGDYPHQQERASRSACHARCYREGLLCARRTV